MRTHNEENCDGLTRSLTNDFPSVQKQKIDLSESNVRQCIAILNIGGSLSDDIVETEVIRQLLSLGIVHQRGDENFYLTDLSVKLYEQFVEDSR